MSDTVLSAGYAGTKKKKPVSASGGLQSSGGQYLIWGLHTL